MSEKTLFIFDYDGTLVEIKTTPEEGQLPEAIKLKLNQLAAHKDYKVAILTGRSLANLRLVVDHSLSREIILIGTHGAEPVNEILESPYEEDWTRWMEIFKDEEHLVFEPKSLTFAIHYKTHPEPEKMREKFFKAYKIFDHKFRIQEGIGVFEIMPAYINKALGIDFLHKKFPEYKLVFFGDDLTDNYAHARVNELGGETYQVGNRLTGKDRVAREIIPSIDAVYKFIDDKLAR